jgi:hypothetical protein
MTARTRLACFVAGKTRLPGTRPGMTSFTREPVLLAEFESGSEEARSAVVSTHVGPSAERKRVSLYAGIKKPDFEGVIDPSMIGHWRSILRSLQIEKPDAVRLTG